MKRLTTTIIFLTVLINAYGQSNCNDSTQIEINKHKVHRIVGFVPSNARTTNGWAIGWSTSVSDYCASMDSIRINGLYTNVSPFQAVVGGMGIIMSPFALFMPQTYKGTYKDTTNYDTLAVKHELNGLAIGLFEYGEDFTMQGIQLTALYHKMARLNGVSATLITSEYKHFKGFMFSGIYNKAYKGEGLQIGLVNKSKKMRGIQIGLWNIIGDRGFPIINMRFKRDK